MLYKDIIYKNIKLLVVALALFFTVNFYVAVALAQSPFHIHSMVVFGDGISDNGNTFAKYKFPVMPPYWHGRFSNGPALAEYMAYALQLIPSPGAHPNYNRHRLFLDYAYFDAVVAKKYKDTDYLPHYSPPDLDDEIKYYKKAKHKPYAANTLVVINLGENDLASKVCLSSPLRCLRDITNTIYSGVNSLVGMGVTHFFIILPGDVRSNPGFSSWVTPKWHKVFTLISRNYIPEFTHVKVLIEDKNPNVHVLLMNSLLVDKKVTSNFTEPLDKPCYENSNGNYARMLGKVCANPNDYLYYDSYFLGTRALNLISDFAIAKLKKNKWS